MNECLWCEKEIMSKYKYCQSCWGNIMFIQEKIGQPIYYFITTILLKRRQDKFMAKELQGDQR